MGGGGLVTRGQESGYSVGERSRETMVKVQKDPMNLRKIWRTDSQERMAGALWGGRQRDMSDICADTRALFSTEPGHEGGGGIGIKTKDWA